MFKLKWKEEYWVAIGILVLALLSVLLFGTDVLGNKSESKALKLNQQWIFNPSTMKPDAILFVGGGTLGDLLYSDGTNWTGLGIGANGEALIIAAGIPSWTGGGGALPLSTVQFSLLVANNAGGWVENTLFRINGVNVTLGTWQGTSIANAYVDDDITLTNITQITNRSHTNITDIGANTHVQIDTHIADVANPHSVTKAQVGLSNVENTALSTWPGSGNITTLGTIASGTWQGTILTPQYGGLGINTSASTGVPFVVAGAWNTEAQVSNTRGGIGKDSSGWNGNVYTIAGGWFNEAQVANTRGGTGQNSLAWNGMVNVLAGVWSQIASTANFVTYWTDNNTIAGEAQLAQSRGGLGIDSSGVTDGQIPIGATAGNAFALANIAGTAGEIDIANGANSITISLATTAISEMFMYESAGSITIDTANEYHLMIGFSTGTLAGWTFNAGSTGPIASFASAGGNLINATDVGHGLVTGDDVSITGTAAPNDYNGVYTITRISDDIFQFTKAGFNLTTTATWIEGSYLEAGAGSAGPYLANWSFTGVAGNPAKTYKFELFCNSSEVDTVAAEMTPAGTNPQNCGSSGFVVIVAGDRVYMGVQNKTDATNLNLEHANLNLHKI